MQTHPVVLMNPASQAIDKCIREIGEAEQIDFRIFREQEDAFVGALRRNNIHVHLLEAETENLPDACFVKDTLRQVGKTLFAGAPKHPERQPEIEPVLEAAERAYSFERVVRMSDKLGPKDSIEFGDSVRLGENFFFGISSRTTARAIEIFADLVGGDAKVIPVEIDGENALHLDMVANPISRSAVLGDFNRCDAAPFRQQGLETIHVPDGEQNAACLMYIPSGDEEVILIPDGFPESIEIIQQHNPSARVVPIPFGEIFKAKAGPNCLASLVYAAS